MKISHAQLIMRQSMPLELKEHYSLGRIRQFYSKMNGDVYVSDSGGIDSRVLRHLVRRIYPTVPSVFVNTGLEYPENVDFLKTIDNLIILRPKMPFNKVIEKYGYPVISKENAQKIHEIRTTKSDKLRDKRINGDEKGNGKLPKKWLKMVDAPFKISHKCCDIMKKNPVKKYEKESGNSPFIGTMAEESRLRQTVYLKTGCNSFDSNRPKSQPLSFWKKEDIWAYIKKYNLQYSKIYDMGYERTGCMFCLFGIHMEKSDLVTNNRMERMKITHPKQYKYCIEKLGCGKVLDYINVNY